LKAKKEWPARNQGCLAVFSLDLFNCAKVRQGVRAAETWQPARPLAA